MNDFKFNKSSTKYIAENGPVKTTGIILPHTQINKETLTSKPKTIEILLREIRSYQFLSVDHLSQPFKVERFESREDKEGIFFIAFRLLDGPLGIGDPHGGLSAYISGVTIHWGLVESKKCKSAAFVSVFDLDIKKAEHGDCGHSPYYNIVFVDAGS